MSSWNKNGLIVSNCYNGKRVENSNQNLSNTIEYVEEICYTTLYDKFGRLGYYNDYLENKSYYYNYDIKNNLIKINIYNNNESDITQDNHDFIEFKYDDDNNLISVDISSYIGLLPKIFSNNNRDEERIESQDSRFIWDYLF